MTDFVLDERFVANHHVADWTLSRVMLSRDARFPWLVLVPRRSNLVELFDLNPADRTTVFEEIARAGTGLKAITGADKINVAALGNQVAQLHIHIVARHRTDPGWPGSPWIAGDPVAYTPGASEVLLKTLRARL
jgi:diadenosine tetraphosphate (Ap4A) HIT family hydrolase